MVSRPSFCFTVDVERTDDVLYSSTVEDLSSVETHDVGSRGGTEQEGMD